MTTTCDTSFPPEAPANSVIAAYAGIGSRSAPSSILSLMERAAWCLADAGWTLRTGLAQGSDQAFHRGALRIDEPVYVRDPNAEEADEDRVGSVELYLPWPGFESQALRRWTPCYPPNHSVLERPTRAAYDVAGQHHPAWRQLKRGVKHLHARNVHQVLGANLDSPSAFVLCWTPDGSLDGTGPRSGGTGQALRIAATHGVPVLNLARRGHRDLVERAVAAYAAVDTRALVSATVEGEE